MGTKATPETILVVDDNPQVLAAVSSILQGAKFNILTAASGPDAVELAHKRIEAIDLLLADWDLHEMNGPALGRVLQVYRPNMHVMLMSGGGASGSIMIMNYGWAVIKKDDIAGKLVQMVTDVLRSPNRSQPGGEEFDSRKDRADRKPTF